MRIWLRLVILFVPVLFAVIHLGPSCDPPRTPGWTSVPGNRLQENKNRPRASCTGRTILVAELTILDRGILLGDELMSRRSSLKKMVGSQIIYDSMVCVNGVGSEAHETVIICKCYYSAK